MSMTTHDQICSRMRAIRIAKGLSLNDVELASNQSIRAVVLGSYERGDRALSVKKAITIADFYGVPLSYLLEQPTSSPAISAGPVIDLRRLTSLIVVSAEIAPPCPELVSVIRFIAGLVSLRNDWNGEVLSMRVGDLTLLAMSVGKSHDQINVILRENHLLLER
ncbi:MAG: helix-turn-helix transcriptional regulator [Actinomycetota bacterium]|nr:helix-turn-helix transcriptional regulator [Actinomycetota bacterium]